MNEKEKNNLPEEEVEVYLLSDEEGNEHEFILLGTCEKNGTEYYAFAPAEDYESEDAECGYVILKSVVENGETSLVSVEDDDEFDDIADYFDDILFDEIDYDAEEKNDK
ncbi:MAG: DUF1292 domain-containing protein [Ruminococcaceae bacterium]|nr:DUF1292 domain-containing protein [Oscillospiraceae bacterium]